MQPYFIMGVLNAILSTALAVLEVMCGDLAQNPFVHVIGVITIGLVVFGSLFYLLHKT